MHIRSFLLTGLAFITLSGIAYADPPYNESTLVTHVPDGWDIRYATRNRGDMINVLANAKTGALVSVAKNYPCVGSPKANVEALAEEHMRPGTTRYPVTGNDVSARTRLQEPATDSGRKPSYVIREFLERKSPQSFTTCLSFQGYWPKKHDAAMSKAFEEISKETHLE